MAGFLLNSVMAAIFRPAEAVAGGRIRLAALDPPHLEQMSGWLALSLAPDWPDYALGAAAEAGDAVLISEEAGREPIGVAVVLLNAPIEGAAAIPFISIDPVRRYRGLGGEAALVLERHLRDRFGVTRVYAPIPDWRGLAVYFWLRQGYRPVTVTEAPWPLSGLLPEARPGIWMLRDTP